MCLDMIERHRDKDGQRAKERQTAAKMKMLHLKSENTGVKCVPLQHTAGTVYILLYAYINYIYI